MFSYNLYFFIIIFLDTFESIFQQNITVNRTIKDNNPNVYNIVNNIITSMINTRELEDNINMKKLLLLYREVKRKSYRYSKIFEAISNKTKPDFYDKIIFNIVNFNNMFNKTSFNEYKNKTYTQICAAINKFENDTTADEIANMIENFTCNFANKINNLILNDRSNTHLNARRNQYNRRGNERISNLKVWAVPNMTDDFGNTRRLFQGRKTNSRKFPFVASVHVNNEFVCGGSIIARCVVITAATCIENDEDLSSKPQNVFTRVGSDFATRGGKKYQVISVHIHPEYDPTNLRNNLAILKLDCDMNDDEEQSKKTRIRRVEYDTLPEQIPINIDEVTALGWGAKHIDDDNFVESLSYSQLNMYHVKDCQSLYTEKYVTLKNFCAGFISKGGGACNRDVGGPGILDGLLVGVISFGSPVCGIPDAPTVFTKLGYYVNWIGTVLEEDQPADDYEDVEKAKQILALIQRYYKEDRKDFNNRVETESTQTNDKTDEEREDANIINTVVQQTSNIEVPDFIKDVYRSLPTKLINLFAKNLDQDLGIPNDDNTDTKERAKTKVESKKSLDLIILPDPTYVPNKYQKVSKMRTSQAHVKAKPTKVLNRVNKQESQQDISRNYESDSDINYNIEIGMSIENK